MHIFLVVHPKKVEDDTKLDSSSIYGSSKVTQEADNVFILQKVDHEVPNLRRLQLVKNRYNGLTGQVSLGFNPKSRRYFELHKLEVDEMMNKKERFDIRQLIERREEKFGCVEPSIT